MRTKSVDAIFYVKHIPNVTVEGGHFHIVYDVGSSARFEFVFTPNTLFKLRAKVTKAIEEFNGGNAEVSRFRRKPAAH